MSKHLEIKQTAVQENVSSAIIEKLYSLTYEDSVLGIDPEVDSQRGDIVGSIRPTGAYEDSVSFLREKFGPDVEHNIDGLTIEIDSNDCYIRFADTTVKNLIMGLGIGDGEGISKRAAANVQSFSGNPFRNNANITSFDELKYFSLIRDCPSFASCTNLTSVDLSNITVIGIEACRYSGIKILNAPNLLTLARSSFRQSALEEVVSLGYVTTPENYVNGSSTFENCTSLKKVTLPDGIIHLSSMMFKGCSILADMNFPSSITTLYNEALYNTQSLKVVGNFPNVTTVQIGIFSGDTAAKACGMRHVYLPKLQSTPVGGRNGTSNNRYDYGFIWSSQWSRKAVFDVLYLRDMQNLGACTFGGGTIRNLVINNITPPVIVSNNGTYNTNNTADLTNYPTQNTDIFFGVDSLLNIYVPDSAFTAYTGKTYDAATDTISGTANAAVGFEEVVDKIQPLSRMNKVATKLLWDELTDTEKRDTLIEEYM